MYIYAYYAIIFNKKFSVKLKYSQENETKENIVVSPIHATGNVSNKSIFSYQ